MYRFVPVFRSWLRFAPLLLSITVLTSCNLFGPFACTDELGVEVRPRERTIRVGESFTAEAIGTSCGGRERFPYAVEWRSADTTIARVNAQSGQVTGVTVGATSIGAYEQNQAWGGVRVTVRAGS